MVQWKDSQINKQFHHRVTGATTVGSKECLGTAGKTQERCLHCFLEEELGRGGPSRQRKHRVLRTPGLFLKVKRRSMKM